MRPGQWAVVSSQWSVVSGQWSLVLGLWSYLSIQFAKIKAKDQRPKTNKDQRPLTTDY